jgi:molecular chaperone DnaK
MNKCTRIVGIDLGTTNSVLAVLEGATGTVIPNAEGSRTTPSLVAYSYVKCVGKIVELIGEYAKRQTVLNPENTFYSVKRYIGRKYEEIEKEKSRMAYKIKDDNNKIKLYCPLLNKEFSPEEISACVLKKLVIDANNFLNEDISKAIITVPAYFNDSQRLATKDAGTIAGLEVLRILNEPTAAALAYGLNKKKNEVVLIFDLGGGTFDVSILEVGNEVFEVLATSGDTHLGGDDFDEIIVKYIMKSFQESEKINLYTNKQAFQRIIEASEQAKIQLSSLQTIRVLIPFICMDIENKISKHIDLQLDRSKFEELSSNLLERCKEPVTKALDSANLTKYDIDQIILVGGSTHIPAVRDILINLLGRPLSETVNPDEVVAIGAAVQGGILAGEITDLILLDVTPLSIGVETMGGLMTTLIPKNVSIPAKRSQIFSTGLDFQDIVEVHVLQGEAPFAKDNKSLGIFRLTGIPSAPFGVSKINVTFQLDVNGLLYVTAREENSGIEQSIRIQGASLLSHKDFQNELK